MLKHFFGTNTFKLGLLFIGFGLLPVFAEAQTNVPAKASDIKDNSASSFTIGIIKGTVKDYSTDMPLLGAQIVIEFSTNGAVTDANGNFVIRKVETGIQTIIVSASGYKTRRFENIRIDKNKTTIINTILKEDLVKSQEVQVTGKRLKDTDISVVSDIQSSQQITSGISSEQIERSQDFDAANIMRRLSSTSLVDGRFVNVRGLAERYNTVMMNDALTPSMEIDSRAFSFDVLPVTALDRIMLFKTGAPELPGEFAGGIIKITTKDIPDENRSYFGFQTTYRNETTAKTTLRYAGTDTDILGYDDGSRTKSLDAYPGFINNNRATQNLVNKVSVVNLWPLIKTTPIPDIRLNGGFARKFYLGKMLLSNITTVNYSLAYQTMQVTRFRYQPGTNLSDFRFDDNQFSQDAKTGALHNWSFYINRRNIIEFRNLFTQIGHNETTIRNGVFYNSSNPNLGVFPERWENNYSFRFEQRSIYSGQLNGTHYISDNTTLKWLVGLAYTGRQEPDWMRARSSGPSATSTSFVFSDVGKITDCSHFYSKMNEKALTYSLNFENILNPYKEEDQQSKFKMGLYVEDKTREYNARWLGYTVGDAARFNSAIPSAPIAQVFTNTNDTTGLKLQEGTLGIDHYSGQNLLLAAYVGTDLHIAKGVNASVGVRVESNKQQVITPFFGQQFSTLQLKVVPLPSANIQYAIDKTHQLRGSYFTSINRPTFRELAYFQYYDFNMQSFIAGNPSLQTCVIQNSDIRYEYFPARGDMLSVGAFHKFFDRPIEMVLQQDPDRFYYNFVNASSATSIGLELEARKSLKGVTTSKVIDNVTLIGNLSFIKSQVKLDGNNGFEYNNRPMQGQAPYIINCGLYYADEDSRSTVNVMYNRFGGRVYSVGNLLSPSQYEMPRDVVDINITKYIAEQWELRMSVQDLLNSSYRIYQDTNHDGQITIGTDKPIQVFQRGQAVTVGLTYKF